VTEAYWKALRNQKHEPHKKGPTVVRVTAPENLGGPPDFDAVVCGGTLGLMAAATLQLRGHRVAVVDKRIIEGRTQEWNISRGELMALHDVGLLTRAEIEACIVSEFNPVRVGFAGGEDLWVDDCLNLGVSPKALLEKVKDRFVAAGGVLMEGVSFKAADVAPGAGVKLTLLRHGTAGADASAPLSPGDVNRPNGLGLNAANLRGPFTGPNVESDPNTAEGVREDSASSSAPPLVPAAAGPQRFVLRTRLLLDCMGHYSDIVKQMRGRSKPDGMVIVVGSCAEGFPTEQNTFGDLLYTIGDAKDDMQVFWEAFPADGGAARTTYMFAYSDAHPDRPGFESLLDTYFTDLAQYQGIPARDLKFRRVLFGGFPCWSNGPLAPAWDHIVQVGDASATQSPLSFGGFGAMLRHLGRLTEGIDDALRCNALSREELAGLHPYQPSLSASWLFQRSMSVGVGAMSGGGPFALPARHVNEVLATNFGVMRLLGDRVLRPFLQDTIQLAPLAATMTGMMAKNPVAITRVLTQVGPATLAGWFQHFFALAAYQVAHVLATPLRMAVRSADPDTRTRAGYRLRRLLDAWEYGTSSDYTYHPPANTGPTPPAVTSFGPLASGGAGFDSRGVQQKEKVLVGAGSSRMSIGSSRPDIMESPLGSAVPVPVPVPVVAKAEAMPVNVASTMSGGISRGGGSTR